MKSFYVFFLMPFLFSHVFAEQLPTDKGTLLVDVSTDPEIPKISDLTKLKIDFVNPKTNAIQEHIDYVVAVTKDGTPVFGPIPLTHTSIGSVTIPVEFKEKGEYKITIDVERILFQPIPQETVTFTMLIGDVPNGGCLVATAVYGTELAPQVQLLREIRDSSVLGTSSGTAFMSAFNSVYYTFSPTVADWERQSPAFREAIKLALTPMFSTLSIFTYAEIDSEFEVLGYGAGIILINVGMYFIAPAIVIKKLHSRRD